MSHWPRLRSRSWRTSSTPTRSFLRISCQIWATLISDSVRGGEQWAELELLPCGAGNALRSTLPLGVTGMASNVTNAHGTMYSGNSRFKYSRSDSSVAPFPSSHTRYATSRLSPGTSSRAITSRPSLPRACSTAPRSLPTPPGIPVSLPDNPLAPDTRSLHPPAIGIRLPSCTTALPCPFQTDPPMNFSAVSSARL